MLYWTKYRCHGNIAGNKPALNNGSDLFRKIQSIDFFPSFVARKIGKILPYWHWSGENFDREIVCNFVFCISTFSEHVLRRISIFVYRRVKRVLNYYSTKFHEILTSGSVENSAFPLNHAVTIFWLTAPALHLTGSRSFSIHTNNPGKAGSNSITF